MHPTPIPVQYRMRIWESVLIVISSAATFHSLALSGDQFCRPTNSLGCCLGQLMNMTGMNNALGHFLLWQTGCHRDDNDEAEIFGVEKSVFVCVCMYRVYMNTSAQASLHMYPCMEKTHANDFVGSYVRYAVRCECLNGFCAQWRHKPVKFSLILMTELWGQ